MPTDLENTREASNVDKDEIEMDELPVNVGGEPILLGLMDDE